MARDSAHSPKVAGRITQAAAKVVVPHAIGDTAPRQRMIGSRQPVRQRRSAGRLGMRFRKLKTSRQHADRGESTRTSDLARMLDVAPFQYADFARRVDPDEPRSFSATAAAAYTFC